MRYITKAELKSQLRTLKKRHPNATYADLLRINQREKRQPAHPSTEAINAALHKAGLGVNRGLYMETPVGIRDGKMQFQWGRKISYRGGTTGRSPLIIAMEAFQLDPEYYLRQFRTARTVLGEYSRVCKGCQMSFVSTRSDANCCSAKCRKRVSRRNVTLNAR